MNSNGRNSPVAQLEHLEKNINKYRRLSISNPRFKNSLAEAERKYQNISRTARLRNIERSISPGKVRGILEQLEPSSPTSSRGSPAAFAGGRRRNRKTRRRSRKTRGRK